jgi:hypothetical protein
MSDHSEYDGGGVMPNTVYPKGADALTAADKLRLQSITGQETDPNAPVDPYHWYGNVAPDPAIVENNRRAKVEKARATERREVDRYRESPGPY